MISFIDTEVNPQTKKVADYGAVREDGANLLRGTHSGKTKSVSCYESSYRVFFDIDCIEYA
jgi:hypothetical protein